METKRLLLSIAIMMGLMMGWKLLVEHLYKQHPEWAPAEQSKTADNSLNAGGAATQSSLATTGPTTSSTASTIGPGLHPAMNAPSAPAQIGSLRHADPTYAMALSINSVGAGLDSVTLNDFFETADQKSLYVFQKPLPNLEPLTRPLGTRSVSINGTQVDESSVNWTQASTDSTSVTYVAIINNDNEPVLEIDKTFQVQPRSVADGSQGYEIKVLQNFKNLSGKPINVKTAFNGPTPPARENDRSEDRQFVIGYDDDKEVKVGHSFLGEYSKDKPTKDLTQLEKLPMLWAGTASSYFDAIVRGEYAGQPINPPIKIAAATGIGANLNELPEQRSASMLLETNEFKLDPTASAPLNLRVFFGPKQRALLKNDYYSSFPLSYDETLVYSGGYCGFLTFNWLINTLYFILKTFHLIFRDWGLAIIGLVCLVRTLLHPITKKSQVNMMQMSKMGPEVERLKKKHGDNKDELNKAMMQFYKTQGFTPVLGCLPMFLQMPIWIALWSALQSTFDLRQAGFLRFGWLHLTWIKDLSHPDFLVHFAQPVTLPFGWQLHGVNVLPILLAGVFFLQQKFQPQPPTQTPEQEQQRKMMQWMSLLFPIMLYSGPSGLNLYILTSTSLGIIESKIVRDHIKEREEAEKAGRIIVDAKPTRASKRRNDDDGPGGLPRKDGPPSKGGGGISGWLANLQKKAEEMSREAERRGKDRA